MTQWVELPEAEQQGRTKRATFQYSPLYIVWPKIFCVVEEPGKVFPQSHPPAWLLGQLLICSLQGFPTPLPPCGGWCSLLCCSSHLYPHSHLPKNLAWPTSLLCIGLSSPWPPDLSSHEAHGLQNRVSVSLIWWNIHQCFSALLYGSMQTWGPSSCMTMAPLAPHCNLQEEDWSQTAAGNKLSYDCLAVTLISRRWYFKMEKEIWALPLFWSCWEWLGFVLVLQRWALRCGAPHSSRWSNIQIKPLTFPSAPVHQFGFCGNRQPNPHFFCLVTLLPVFFS